MYNYVIQYIYFPDYLIGILSAGFAINKLSPRENINLVELYGNENHGIKDFDLKEVCENMQKNESEWGYDARNDKKVLLTHNKNLSQREDQIGLLFAGSLVGIDQRDTIENMPGIQKENGNGGGQNRGVVCQQAYGQELGGTCVHKQGHGKGPA